MSNKKPAETCVFIKWMHLGSAAGDMSQLVFLIQVTDMPDGEFYSYQITGLCAYTTKGVGIIYFCNTRAGNDTLWEHWFVNVAIPFMKDIAVIHDHRVSYLKLFIC